MRALLPKLPRAITTKRRTIKERVAASNKVQLYAQANHIDNFVLPVHKMVLDEFMNIVIKMDGEALSRNDWWEKGFKPGCDEHSGLLKLSVEIAKEIYTEFHTSH